MRFNKRPKKCQACKKKFQPDPRTRFHQRFCEHPICRKASKIWSQKRWLAKPENKNCWRGASEVLRVQLWREKTPNYWKLKDLR